MRVLGGICCGVLAFLFRDQGLEKGPDRIDVLSFNTSVDFSHQTNGPKDEGTQRRRWTLGIFRPQLFCGAYVPPPQSTFEDFSDQSGYSHVLPAAALIAAAVGSTTMAVQHKTPVTRLFDIMLKTGGPWFLVIVAVLQKCATDTLTWGTQAAGATYSGSSVVLLSEVLNFPVLMVAVAVSESPSRVWPMFKSILNMDWRILLLGSGYAAQSLLYFICLSNISPVGYQMLSQTRLFVTAMLMRFMMQKCFSVFQIAALLFLFIGAVCTQLEEVSLNALRGSQGNVAIGCALTVLSSLLSALPNVWYESILKETKQTPKSQWECNIQLTVSILLWVILMTVFSPVGGFDVFKGGNSVSSVISSLCTGYTPAVWVIVFLKSLNCVIVPCCLKYADNVMYNFAKPLSICVSCAGLALYSSTWPSARMVAAICLVILSISLYRIRS